MSYKHERLRYLFLARLFVIVSVIGVGILIYTNLGHNPTDVVFSLIAFIISVAALIMTTLQSMSISRQVQITEHSARLVHETAQQLELLIVEDKRIVREIRQDIRLDREIIAVLEEHGIGDSNAQRHAVARRIAEKLVPIENSKT